jgi:hypothetical protein
MTDTVEVQRQRAVEAVAVALTELSNLHLMTNDVNDHEVLEKFTLADARWQRCVSASQQLLIDVDAQLNQQDKENWLCRADAIRLVKTRTGLSLKDAAHHVDMRIGEHAARCI